MKQSAGLLLFRKIDAALEFFLVHPGGPFFARKDAGFWTIPKGEPLDQEELLKTAIREFEEETGCKVEGDFIVLDPVIQKGGKKVFCWAVEFNLDADEIRSNTFEIEWPPRSGKMKTFPEIDRAAWLNYTDACKYINEKQIPFLESVLLKFS